MRARTFITLATFFLIAPIGGCNMSSAERVAVLEQQVAQWQGRVDKAEHAIAAADEFIVNSSTLLTDPNLPAELVAKITARLDEAQAYRARSEGVRQKAATALAYWQQQRAAIGEVTDIGGELQVYGQTISSVGSVLPPPVGTYAALAGGLVAAIGGVVVGLKKAGAEMARADAERDKATTMERNLRNVIHSVDSLLDSPQIVNEDDAKALLADRQGTTTATVVKAVKNG